MVYNIRGKITELWLVKTEGISVCFVTMASRFEIVDEEGIDELKELSENENTKKSTEQWKNVFVTWATERGKEKNLEAYECVDLD